MVGSQDVRLLPDAGPLITLAYADALALLFKPNWALQIVDMVLHEVTRHSTPTSAKLSRFVSEAKIPIFSTQLFKQYQMNLKNDPSGVSTANLGELAIQEAMTTIAMARPTPTAVFLFEDHKIARASFIVPSNCRKISTRAYLQFLEQKGWIESASAIERSAIQAGRAFSSLRQSPTG